MEAETPPVNGSSRQRGHLTGPSIRAPSLWGRFAKDHVHCILGDLQYRTWYLPEV